MNLASVAMRRPVTVIVTLVAIVLGAALAVQQMPRDILPTLGLPVIYVAQPYSGVDATQMEGFVTYYYEYHFLYITGIEHVESKSIQGVSLVKLQFHPGTDMSQAMAETISYVNRARAFMPPGTVPPFVMRFDSGSVPVGELVFSSDTRSVPEIQDAALNRVRPLFATLPGVSAPPPFGGSARTITIRADPDRLRAYHMSPDELVSAITSANSLSPSGNIRIGDSIPVVQTNALVSNIKELESVPIRPGTTDTVFVRDVAKVEDSSDIATGYALVNGRRTVYIPVTKRADASTLSVVNLVKANLGKFQAALPDGVSVRYEFDQSPYVTQAISGLALEGLLGAMLTGAMVLLFLRNGRSAFIVVLNIPLSLLAALWALRAFGQTINIMTLGGLALAVGILVDEASVTIENIHTHLGRGRSLARAALDATTETAAPRFLAMLCILAVFTPALFMSGAIRALFVPLSLAVGLSMIASYILSSTFVPILSTWILRGYSPGRHTTAETGGRGFARTKEQYGALVRRSLRANGVMALIYIVGATLVIGLVGSRLGSEIFPRVDAGQIQLRLRAPAGTRIERTEEIAQQTLRSIEAEAGKGNLEITLGFVGVQPSSYPINTIHLWTGGPEEAVLQVQLKRGSGIRIADFQERLRSRLRAEMPEVRLSFEQSDIVSRVMSFGSPTPVEIAISGPSLTDNRVYAETVRNSLARVSSLRDLEFGQSIDYPSVQINVNRERAGVLGITTGEIVRSTVAATSSSRFVTPNYWADPKSGVAYQVQVEIPTSRMNSLGELRNLPVTGRNGASMLLRDVANVEGGTTVGEYDRYNMQRIVTLNANIYGEDLGSVARRVTAALKESGTPPAKVNVAIRGQIAPMEEMLSGLRIGFALAVVAIFLMLAGYFQSVRLALTALSTVPAVAAGVALALWLTGTTLNVQSFMGAIMAIGVAVANAILLVTFAERARITGMDSAEAAATGAQSRLRPILMTSLAMIAGMAPMAFGIGEGGDQSAPLGRAVIGGLVAASLATLFVLPAIFALLQGKRVAHSVSLDPDDPLSPHFDASKDPSNASSLTLLTTEKPDD